MLRYCIHCKEYSIARKVKNGKVVEYCINKGCKGRIIVGKVQHDKTR